MKIHIGPSEAAGGGSPTWSWIAWAGAASAIIASLAVLSAAPSNPDEAWLLEAGARMLDGARLGRDLIEVNPPLVVWCNAAVVWVARLLDVAPASVLHALLIGLIAIVTAWSVAWVPPGHPASTVRALPVVVAGCLAILPTSEFGQREHFAAVLALPWLLLTARRSLNAEVSTWLAVGAGGLAGLGLALKPFFLLVPVAVWLGGLLGGLRGHVRRPETLALLLAVAAYGLAIPALAPEFLPFARDWYPVYARLSRFDLVYLPVLAGVRPLVALALLVLGLLAFRRRLPAAGLELVLGLAAAGFAGAALAQWKPWTYHWLPSAMLGWLGLTLAATRVAPEGRWSRIGRAALVLACVSAAVAYTGRWLWWAHAQGVTVQRASEDQVRSSVQRFATGKSVAGFSFSHGLGFPAVPDAGGQWALRVNSLQLLAALRAEGGSPKGLADASPATGPRERELVAWIREDLLRAPPALLIDDWPARPAPGRVSLMRWLGEQDPVLDSLFATYRVVERLEELVIYRPAGVP